MVIVHEGQLVTSEMARQRLTFDDLIAAAREQGIRRVSDIEIAGLETNGRISFFTPESPSSGADEGPAVG